MWNQGTSQGKLSNGLDVNSKAKGSGLGLRLGGGAIRRVCTLQDGMEQEEQQVTIKICF